MTLIVVYMLNLLIKTLSEHNSTEQIIIMGRLHENPTARKLKSGDKFYKSTNPQKNPQFTNGIEIVYSQNIKQLSNEAEHDVKNYPDRGQCYLPKPKVEAYNIDRGLDNS